MAASGRIKRRRLLIDPVFQYRFVKKVTAMGVLVVLFAMVGVLVVLSLMKRHVAQPDPFSSSAIDSLASMPDIPWIVANLWPYLLLAVALVVVVSVLFGVLESFRIAGPAYRIRLLLKGMSDGDLSEEPISLRRKDELEKLCAAILHTHGSWRQRIADMQQVFDLKVDDEAKVELLRDKLFAFKIGATD